MTQAFSNGVLNAITVVEAGPCTITQVRSSKDGYSAVQLGYDASAKNVSKALKGHLNGLKNFKYLKEFRVSREILEKAGAERGKEIGVTLFKSGDIVKVSGTSKGKGFQGVVKRHGFHGSPKTHGHKDQERMPGSIGAGGLQRVLKGTRMGGRMGGGQATVTNIEVIDVDAEKNLIFFKGAVPGGRNGLLAIYGDGDLEFIEPTVAEVKGAIEAKENQAVPENQAEESSTAKGETEEEKNSQEVDKQ